MQTIKTKNLFTFNRFLLFAVIVFLLSFSSFALYRYSLPIPEPSVLHLFSVEYESAKPVNIAWPESSQASFGTLSDGLLASKPGQTSLPAASTAKVIAALTILEKRPLKQGEQGPVITMSPRDLTIFNEYSLLNGSTVPVQTAQQWTQYQLLQGILIRSGNNLADSLAVWAFGSLSEYRSAAQEYVKTLGMKNTTIGSDASGFSPSTTTTAEDLTLLGIAAMNNQVVREIVSQPAFTLQDGSTLPNTNRMLGERGVTGIKTGSLPSIGGVFMIAKTYEHEGELPITLVGAVQGEPDSSAAISRANELTENAKKLFKKKTFVHKDTHVATITTPWGEETIVTADSSISAHGWKYRAVEPQWHISPNIPIKKGSVVGILTIDGKTTDLVANSDVDTPSWQWRLSRRR